LSNQGRRGRPLGFKLSDESRRAISESKKGQKHKEATKDKISQSLIIHFRKKNPLSEELTNMYCRFEDHESGEIYEWVVDNTCEINQLDDIMTMKALRNARRIEISFGPNIEFFSHEVTPEMLVLFKEVCEKLDKDPMEFFDELG